MIDRDIALDREAFALKEFARRVASWRPLGTAWALVTRHTAKLARRMAVGATPTAGMTRVITLLAGLAALTIAAVVPVSWYLAAHARLRGEVEVHAQMFAYRVEREAQQNPAFWNALAGSAVVSGLESMAIAQPVEAAEPGDAERRRVLSGAGDVLIDIAPPIGPAWPRIIAGMPVMDGVTRLGAVEVVRSLRPDLIVTAVLGCLAGALGTLIFLLLRSVPLRMLDAAVENASFLSAHDGLTGLPNRRLFHDRLEQALTQACRDNCRVALFYLDLDHFKVINDLMGHPAGDAMLRTVADRIRRCLRDSDTLARLGGDEFAVIQPVLRRIQDADVLGQRLIEAIAPPLSLDGQLRTIGISGGVAISVAGNACSPELLMQQADMALHRAKQEGRGRVCFFTPDMDETLRERHAMESDLRVALVQRDLAVHYQAQVNLTTGRICGAEALLRWNRPGHGMVGPDKFIPLAEDTGMIVSIGLWVLREACLRAMTWPDDVSIAVNVSAVQFRDREFCQAMIDTIIETGIAPSRVELEITEGVLLRDTEDTLDILNRLRDFGTRLAMDDFGTGYSSLAYLSKFHFDKVKIDRAFTARICEDADAVAIVRAVVGLSEALGASTIAEGVETSGQAELLRAYGCAEGQGYLFSRPVPGEMFDALVRRGGSFVERPRHSTREWEAALA